MIRSSLKTFLLILLPAGVFLSSCGQPEGDPGPSENSEKIVLARINGTPVLLSEFVPYIQSFLDDDPEDLGGISTRELFDEYLSQVLLLKEADKAGIEIPQEELEQYMSDWSISQEETASREMEPMIRDYLKVQKEYLAFLA